MGLLMTYAMTSDTSLLVGTTAFLKKLITTIDKRSFSCGNRLKT